MAITVDYTELAGSPREHIAHDGTNVVRTLTCAWGDRIQLAKELIGYVVGSIVHAPDAYDAGDVPLYYIYAKAVNIEPIGDYTKAKLTVTYKSLDYDVDGPSQTGQTTYVTENLEPSLEFLTLSDQKLYWDSARTAANKLKASEVPSYIVRMTDWVYTIHRTYVMPAAVIELPGYVNSSSVYSYTLDYTFGAETLLCGNPSMLREFTSDGIATWTVTFRFTHKPEGWNNFPRTSNNASGITWGPIYQADSANRKVIYPLGNFNALIP
jgi:hypothetical protein